METGTMAESTQGQPGWRINGGKMWNTGLHVAMHDLIFARMSGQDGDARGITCFILPFYRCRQRLKTQPVLRLRRIQVTVWTGISAMATSHWTTRLCWPNWKASLGHRLRSTTQNAWLSDWLGAWLGLAWLRAMNHRAGARKSSR